MELLSVSSLGATMESRTQKKHRLHYINWNTEATLQRVTTGEFAGKLADLKSHGGVQVAKKTVRFGFIDFNYFIEDAKSNKHWKRLYYFDCYTGKYIIYSTNTFDETKNKRDTPKHSAIASLTAKFREFTGLGRSALKIAFWQVPAIYKQFIPKQFYYMNPKFLCKESYDAKRWIECSEIDDSSHYPAAGCGLLPDASANKVVPGRVAPTEEYPFAFYPDTRHVAQYGEFDTHEWLKKPYAMQLFDLRYWAQYNGKDSRTILMKASKYELTDTWKYFYSQRKADAGAKLVMNSAIGYMHQQDKRYDRYPFAHLAAVIIARANEKHIRMIDKIGFQHIVQVVVDSIVYTGRDKWGAPTAQKDLGVYVQEFTRAQAIFRGTQCCAMFGGEDKNFKKIKTSGFNALPDGSPLNKEYKDSLTPETISEMWQWIKVKPI